MKHWPHGGSTAEKRLNCPGQFQLAQAYPNLGSEFAAKGSMLHNLCELQLNAGKYSLETCLDFVGHIEEHDGFQVTLTEDDVREKLWPALQAYDELCATYGLDEFETEVECVHPDHPDEIGGHSDVIAVGEGVVAVIDWKFGDGVQVFPDQNPQALFYGMCARLQSSCKDMFEDADKVLLVIIQPTDRDDIENLRVWETTPARLDRFEKEYLAAYRRAIAPGAAEQTVAGPHCKFCPAQPSCPSKTGAAARALRLDPETVEDLSEALAMADELQDWIRAVQARAFDQLNLGQEIPGYKLVRKRAITRWIDEDKALKALYRLKLGKGNYTTSKIISPTQAKKVLRAQGKDSNIIDDLIEKRSSGLTLAPEDDARPAAPSSAALGAALRLVK